jgi:hypothetical protein
MKTENEHENRATSNPQALAAQPRKPYSSPTLIAHGTLQEITGNVGNGFVDFPMGSRIAG